MDLIASRSVRVVAVSSLLTALAVVGCQPKAAPPPKTTAIDSPAKSSSKTPVEPVQFTKETLPNGLRVLYVPLKDTPVAHVRVLYHVGSRDERPDRQGFAHMFEHMMFRGSAHVAPEEHMKLIGIVGGYSNAFTSMDQTAYVNTVPANHLEMALYLEADRMSSFKVSPDIYKVERNVVAKEWGIRQNRPGGTVFEDFLGAAFTTHSYRWTTIGNMEHLKQASADELQAFFNKYYLPNNAVLVVAGKFDEAQTREWVKKYYGWIPKGPDVVRDIPPEPMQTAARFLEVKRASTPVPTMMVGYKIPQYTSPDIAGLEVLGAILGDGRTSRLDMKLVNSENPLCQSVNAGPWQLQDGGVFFIQASALQGKDPATIEKELLAAVDDIIKNGVTEEEVKKAKLQSQKSIVASRAEADDLGGQVGEEELFGGNAARVNTSVDELFAVTPADVKRVAGLYLQRTQSTTLRTLPDPLGTAARAAAKEVGDIAKAPVATTTSAPVEPRKVEFPAGYPQKPPMSGVAESVTFKKGVEKGIAGVTVIVMEDHRLPQVSWNLTMRRGGQAEPVEKSGLGSMTASMVRRGTKSMDFQALNEDLENRAISLEVTDGGDFTRIAGSAITEQVEHGFTRTAQLLTEPSFPADEFAKLKEQTITGLAQSQANPAAVAAQDYTKALYGDSALGHVATPQTVAAVTLDDVKKFHASVYTPAQSVLIISGDITVAKGLELAKSLTDAWVKGQPRNETLVAVDYKLPPYKGRRVILVDNPAGKQSVLRIGLPAYDIHTDDKFAGMVAGQILSAGIDSRLGRYVRAEKGYVYGVGAYFQPGRHAGTFGGSTETAFETTGATVDAMFKVFGDMRNEPVTPTELAEAQSRVAGGMIMDTQTIEQQAGRRVDAILNQYPIDYWDNLPGRVAKVTADQVREVMNRYVKDDAMTIVVIAPAEKVKDQLEKFGKVEILPMPSKRTAATQPSSEMLK